MGDGLAIDEVFRLPRLFFRRGLDVVGDRDGRRMNEGDDCEQGNHDGNPRQVELHAEAGSKHRACNRAERI